MGGDDSDSASLNVDAISQQAFTPTDVVGHVDITGDGLQNDDAAAPHRERRRRHVPARLHAAFGPGDPHERASRWDAPASAVRDALAAMLDQIGLGYQDTDKKVPNVGVTVVPGGYTIDFINDARRPCRCRC